MFLIDQYNEEKENHLSNEHLDNYSISNVYLFNNYRTQYDTHIYKFIQA